MSDINMSVSFHKFNQQTLHVAWQWNLERIIRKSSSYRYCFDVGNWICSENNAEANDDMKAGIKMQKLNNK